MKIIPIEGYICDSETGKGVVSEVIIHTKFTRESTNSNELGYFRASGPEGEVAGIDVLAKGYSLKTTMLKILPTKISALQFKLNPALPGTRADVENLLCWKSGSFVVKIPACPRNVTQVHEVKLALKNRNCGSY